MTKELSQTDKEIHELLVQEQKRQETMLTMIPSENHVSKPVREAVASHLMNKYSEGYPGRRYYQGNAVADAVETLAIERAKALFGADHANVQPYSGSPANFAVYLAFLEPGDTVLGFDLSCGGHLTHGSPVNFSGKHYNVVTYGLDKETQLLDMEEIRRLAKEHKPKLIISGLTAYPRIVDFAAFGAIAKEVGAIHLADVSHISGLIVAGQHPSPIDHADVVMTTTHKTLRGPRGAMLLCKEEHAKTIDKAVFPGCQGGPHDNTTAAMAVAFHEATLPEFSAYAKQVVRNAKVLAKTLMEQGLTLVTGGTDNHLILIDLLPFRVGLGKKAAKRLENAGIVTNRNTVPYDPSTPFKPSGIRLGTPALTTRGMKEKEMEKIGKWIAQVLHNLDDDELHARIKDEVADLCKQFPLP